jgi:hypothetical protein
VAQWTYQLADLLTGAVTAEIELTGVRISRRLNAAGTLNGTWPVPNNWAGGSPYVLTTPARTMVTAFRDGRPMYGGVLWTRRPDPERQTIELGCADWFSYFDHRFVLPLFTPNGTTSQVSMLNTSFSQVEQNEIVRQLVAQAQAHTGGNLGIVVDSTNSGILRDRTYAGHELVDVGTALKQLAEVIDGPDLAFGVSPELDANGRVVKTLRVGNPKLGQEGSAHVFELGANVRSYSFDSDGTRMATRQYATGEGIEAGQLVAVAENTVRASDGWPILETETSFNTVSLDTTLQEHADAELARNSLPVVTPTLTVDASGLDANGRKVFPSAGEVTLGDQVRFVAKDWFFKNGISTIVRVVGIEYQPEGTETMVLSTNVVLDDLA